MMGERIKNARIDRGYTLQELSKLAETSPSTISRIENQKNYKADPKVLYKIADALGFSISNLMEYPKDDKEAEKIRGEQILDMVVEDNDMSPELPEGAIVKVRTLMPNEKLQDGSFYFIDFNNQKKFRLAIDYKDDGLGFVPLEPSEARISYDREYVNIIGKAISMKVIFEDVIEYEVS